MEANREDWKLALHTRPAEFISFLRGEDGIQEQNFKAKAYDRKITRYSVGEPSPYELAQSLSAPGYLSHASASMLHGLAPWNVRQLYLNIEQSPKPNPSGQLSEYSGPI
jgi:hypothetical protein